MTLTVGERIRRRRRKLGLTQRQAATQRVSYAYISRIEAGQRTPSLSALIEIAEKLDVTALELLRHNASRIPCPLCQRHP